MATWTRALMSTVSLDYFPVSNMRNRGDRNLTVYYECKENRFISIPFLQSSQFINDLTLSHGLSKQYLRYLQS